MLLKIENVLDAAQVAHCRRLLDSADWADGRMTAGYLSARVKSNEQLPETSPVARQLGQVLLDILDANQTFLSAALPLKVVPPLFNRYAGGQAYGPHVDGAIRPVLGTPHRVRTDISATLFLTAPEDYDGGELVVNEGSDSRAFKLKAGDMLLYPGTSVHHVAPVTRGARISAFFWIQSMVRTAHHRAMLFELDTAIQNLGREGGDHDAAVRIAGVYHNLLREWADS